MCVKKIKKAIDVLNFALKTWNDVNVINEIQKSLKFKNDSMNPLKNSMNSFINSMNSLTNSMNSFINSMNSFMSSLNHVVR